MDSLLSQLIGKSMWASRRAADMATFQFGQRKQVRDYYGRSTEVGDYALHVQCPWRIVRGDAVVVGSDDLYYPASHINGTSIPEDFNWDRDPNRRDSLLNALFEGGKREFAVQRVDIGRASACRIDFNDGIRLELFPNDSVAHEHWRVLATQDDGTQELR